MQPITHLPVPDDIDADYSPQYVKLARLLRGRITSGEYRHGARLPATVLAAEYRVSKLVARRALEMLEDNGYVRRVNLNSTFDVTWQPAQDEHATAPGQTVRP